MSKAWPPDVGLNADGRARVHCALPDGLPKEEGA